MSLCGAAAVVGLAEHPPRRYTEGETTLGLLAQVAMAAIEDSGLPFDAIDGLLVPGSAHAGGSGCWKKCC